MTNESISTSPTSVEAAQYAYNLLSAERQKRTDLTSRLKKIYITNENDDQLESAIDQLFSGAIAEVRGERIDGRSLMIVGETGAGKTHALNRQFRQREEFRPYDTDIGQMLPLISLEAPSPCTLKQLGRKILEALNCPLNRDLHTHLVWEKVRQQLKARRTTTVHVGEMQHVFQGSRSEDVMTVSNTLKNTMQQPLWPVRFIFSGLPSLVDFKSEDAQIWWRCRVLRFKKLGHEQDDFEFVLKTIEKIAHQASGLDTSEVANSAFYARLIHTVQGAYGRMIELLTDTCIEASCSTDPSRRSKLTIADFASTYRSFSGCVDNENIFLAERFYEISPFQKHTQLEKLMPKKHGRRKQ